MNSEELEVSLKTEFENYLNGLAGEMRRNITDFQAKIEAEFEKHRTQLDEAFRELNGRFENEHQIDKPFREMIADHLRLARDDGARVAATAFGEAEKLAAEMEKADAARYDLIRDAVNEISGEHTQAAILQALLNNSARFAARGALFIVRGDNLMGWNAFADGQNQFEDRTREIIIPVQQDTLPGRAISEMRPLRQSDVKCDENQLFLEPLNFAETGNGAAIPLIVRGRAVAVIYADSASEGETVNTEPLETLVQVAALTVDLRAGGHSARPARDEEAASTEQSTAAEPDPVRTDEVYSSGNEFATISSDSYAEDQSAAEFREEEYNGAVAVEEAEPIQQEVEDFAAADEEEPAAEESFETPQSYAAFEAPVYEPEIEAVVEFEADVQEAAPEIVMEAAEAEYTFAEEGDFAPPSEEIKAEEAEVFAEAEAEPVSTLAGTNGDQNGPAVVEAAAPKPVRSRFSERKVDLPIEVAEDERGLHNKALLFARLLVSEIKLYNKERVQEGREAGDLYDRLREAIDRSREMYDKRVEPVVSSKFDYFHYELVNGLAEGAETKLGSGYPGPA